MTCECGSPLVVASSDIGGGVRYWCERCRWESVARMAFEAMDGTEWDSETLNQIAHAFEVVGIKLRDPVDEDDPESACECLGQPRETMP